MWPGRRWVGGGVPRAGRQFKWLPGHCDISHHLKIMVLKLEITETRRYYWRHCDRRRSCWCGVVIQCPVSGLVVVRGGAGRRPTQPRPHPIPPSPRPDQYNFTFPAFSGRLSSSPQQCQWKWKLNGESTGLQVFSMYRLIIMTGEGDMEFCIRILMKDKYWIPTNHVSQARRGPVGV